MMDHFAKIVNVISPLTIFAIISIIDVWQGPKYASELYFKFITQMFSDISISRDRNLLFHW